MKPTTRNNIADVWYKIGINLASALFIAVVIHAAIMESLRVDLPTSLVILAGLSFALGFCYIGFITNEKKEDAES